ncbi:hypothetical protein OOK31_38145 [Streptomyces sp. NBC_00249]|uniref:hypothetical protein n=1 Tax=Streptomyces sp. NBC_00249 TaxID=2975690 RepID=UPI00224F62C1|nr:hypothetical protein [Streptomyces sp. NBC_00249]MCX5199635.1 hypothetical protein [Streptomyces sp. NBC_00249]
MATDTSVTRLHAETCEDCGAVRLNPAPTQALLDRARVGWERFLSSFEEAGNE